MANEEQDEKNDFDDIKVKEMWQVEAIQVLKKYENDLSAFVTDSVSFNTRFERIEFNAYHKQLLEMGKLSSR